MMINFLQPVAEENLLLAAFAAALIPIAMD